VPLQPDGSNTVVHEFIRMPDSAGFGSHTESGILMPAPMGTQRVNFTDLPVRGVPSGLHLIAHLTPPVGNVLHDYLAN
jgi:acetoacetate decarboxylase